MKIIKYFLYSLILSTIIFIFLFYNLGNILDVTQKPIKSDVIICLGGGDKDRIKKTIDLYNKDYSSKKILILTGDDRSKSRKEKNMSDKRISYIKENGFTNIKLIHNKNTKSTKEEIIFIKNFLLQKNYSNAIIISDPPHTRRIKILIDLIKIKGDTKLKFNLVGTDAKWWNSNTYYTNKKAQVFVLFEVLKIGYTYIAYGILDKIGLLSTIENSFVVKDIRKQVNKKTYFYLKDK